MNLFTGESSDEFFGGAVPAASRDLLHRASRASASERAALLWTAQALAPQCLALYYTLYKHHAGQREFGPAQRAAERGLAEAARQAGLPADWRFVAPGAPPVDFADNGPARFWLFTLKAMAFLALRQQQPAQARALLAQIQRLQPQAGMGDEVIDALLQALGPTP